MTSPISRPPSRRPPPEMQQKNTLLLHESFFSLKGVQERPVSVATEFMESDFDDDEILSDFEDADSSPRASLNSSGQPSFTTVSSYDEVQTPRSSRAPATEVQIMLESSSKQVEGPRGPHLFRISTLPSEYESTLSLSPLTPKAPKANDPQSVLLPLDVTPLPIKKPQSGPFRFTDADLDKAQLATWSPEGVAQWMLNAGIELQVCERFVENDITGAILITLKFEDLKELGIPSFGVRTTVWHQISEIKNIRAASTRPETPIEDVPDRKVRRELRRHGSHSSHASHANHANHGKPPRRRTSSRRKVAEDAITPLESVSIVGIEQLMPKPHQCSKGENCSKWKRSQRMIEAFKREHPFADTDKGGIIMIAGDPGNPQTAKSIGPSPDEVFRPVSDAIPSVVASSDVMGPDGMSTTNTLQEDSLRTVQLRDPQDNVRQFLSFQHQHGVTASEVPPTPPFELFPGRRQQPHEGLRTLPKLSIPAHARHSSAGSASAGRRQQPRSAHPVSAHPSLGSASASGSASGSNSAPPLSSKPETAVPSSSSSYSHTAMEESPGNMSATERTPTAAVYRFGTPFSEMDVPVTAVPVGPVAREVSQSVPPDMNYRAPPVRTMSRASGRRPSFPVLPAVVENRPTVMMAGHPGHQRTRSAVGYRNGTPMTVSTSPSSPPPASGSRVLQPPPRFKYPWSPERTNFETAIAPLELGLQTGSSSSSSSLALSGSTGLTTATTASSSANGVSSKAAAGVMASDIAYQGMLKKRRTKMLRHEWNDRYVTLRGTRLAVHKDAQTIERTLEYVDIDDYAIACSSMAASTSKLNAAFKAMNIRRGSAESLRSGSKGDVAAFSFQLIPQDGKGGVRLRKRESSLPSMGLGMLASSSSSSSSSMAMSSSAANGGSAATPVVPSSMATSPPPPPADAVNGTGKTHHFAVKSRDERIEWMRELMLAKAMRQKGEGFEVSVNGNMI